MLVPHPGVKLHPYHDVDLKQKTLPFGQPVKKCRKMKNKLYCLSCREIADEFDGLAHSADNGSTSDQLNCFGLGKDTLHYL